MSSAGSQLRLLRERLGLTLRDVESAAEKIAEKYANTEFLIPPSRLSDLETKGVVPSIFRLYSLAAVYRRDILELISWFGVDVNGMADDVNKSMPTKSHPAGALASITAIKMPIHLDPGFDSRHTANFSRMIEKWGTLPMTYLEQFAVSGFTYGYIGSEDLTMDPILPPGTFVQVDESKHEVVSGGWRSEYERPIYFVETREGYTCCWCTLNGDGIILQSHPLSPVAAKVLRYPQQAEVIGQVVGAAIRLGGWHAVNDPPRLRDDLTCRLRMPPPGATMPREQFNPKKYLCCVAPINPRSM